MCSIPVSYAFSQRGRTFTCSRCRHHASFFPSFSDDFHQQGRRSQLVWSSDKRKMPSLLVGGGNNIVCRRQCSSSTSSSSLFQSKQLYYSNNDGSLSDHFSEEIFIDDDAQLSSSNSDKDVPFFLNQRYFTNDIMAPFPDVLHYPSIYQNPYDDNDGGGGDTTSSREKENIDFVSMLRSSASQLATHKKKYVVFHIPGDLVKKPDEFTNLMNDIAISRQLGVKPVIVAGSCFCYNHEEETSNDLLFTQQHETSSFHEHVCSLSFSSRTNDDDGKRSGCLEDGIKETDSKNIPIIDYTTLNLIKAEIGMIRFEIENQLAKAFNIHSLKERPSVDQIDERDEDEETGGGNVISGTFYSALPYGIIDGIDYQYTGYPRRFQVDKIKNILEADDVVLLTSLGSTPSGEIYNVNSKHLTNCLGEVLDASEVVFCSEEEGEEEEESYYT